jgi:hypothetical protein
VQEAYLVHYADARPFEAFRIYVTDGRAIDVRHPEMAMVATHALALWLFHERGQIEILDGSHLTALRMLGAADPENFIGSNK